MIEMKLTNGDVIKNYDNENFTKWIFTISKSINDYQIYEESLKEWLEQEAGE